MVRFTFNGLPPSANHAYFNLPRGGRTLTTKGKKYKNETKTLLAKNYAKELTQFRKNCPYIVYIRLYFELLENATYGKAKGTENRYKTLDASNRVKLLEDVLKDVTGVDDSHTMTIITEKRLAPEGQEKTEVFIWNVEQEESPFDEVLFSL